jgi:hypothetical protein
MGIMIEKKLIYFTLGFNKNYIELAKLCIGSLEKTGYNGDILFITDNKEDILKEIKYSGNILFMDTDDNSLNHSSSNKLKIYKYKEILNYEKIIFCDLDVIWLKSPNILFDTMTEDKFYFAEDGHSNLLMSSSENYYGAFLMTQDEINKINKNQIKGLSAGFFGFKINLLPHLEKINELNEENINKSNCAEQPSFNVYVWRNDLYVNLFNGLVNHAGYWGCDIPEAVVIHFPGGIGNFNVKYNKMLNYLNNFNSRIIVHNTRNDMFKSFKKNLIICEIGVFKGEFSKFIYDEMQPKELHLIDPFKGMMCSGDKDGNNVVWTNLEEEYSILNSKYSSVNNVKIHKDFSFNVLKNFQDEYFDLIYIDGDHSYHGVKTDLELAYIKTKKDGYICGHDYTKTSFPGVVKAVDEFCLEKNLKINFLSKDGCPTFCIIKK